VGKAPQEQESIMEKQLDLVTIQVTQEEARMITTALTCRALEWSIQAKTEPNWTKDDLAEDYKELAQKVQAQKVAQFEVAQ
jgi:hypothetical protein